MRSVSSVIGNSKAMELFEKNGASVLINKHPGKNPLFSKIK
jgi:hypothetical protein